MDINAIKARLAAMSNSGQKRRDIWKPKDKHTIRCVPYSHGPEPFIELWFHYELGTANVLCPKFNFGDECPICEFAEKLRAWKDESGNDKPEQIRKADFEIFKKIQAKARYYVAMIERDVDGDVTPKFWAFGKANYEKLLGFCCDEEMNEACGLTGDARGTSVLFNPKKAFDLKIDFKQANNKDKKGNTKNFPITEIEHKLAPTLLAKTQKEIDTILEGVIDIKEVYPVMSAAEVNKIFFGFVNSGAQPVDAGSPKNDEYSSNSAEKPIVGGRSLDEAFNEIENEQ